MPLVVSAAVVHTAPRVIRDWPKYAGYEIRIVETVNELRYCV